MFQNGQVLYSLQNAAVFQLSLFYCVSELHTCYIVVNLLSIRVCKDFWLKMMSAYASVSWILWSRFSPLSCKCSNWFDAKKRS